MPAGVAFDACRIWGAIRGAGSGCAATQQCAPRMLQFVKIVFIFRRLCLHRDVLKGTVSMMSCRDAFQGEEALERLLRKAGSAYSVADLAALVAGVEAAPPGEDADAWMTLVA